MSFLVFLAAGVCGGILGGMGMGGGTALIPILTLLCGVGQRTAQGVNLAAFLPMSLGALAVHARTGLVEKKGALRYALPALPFSAIFSLLAAALPQILLRAGFGIFLSVLAAVRLAALFPPRKTQKRSRSS